MKVIDLLNKIANGEELPEKIRINNIIYEYQGDDYLFEDKNNDNHEYWLFSSGYTDKFQWLDDFLNTEVEIIEENNKIEKLDIQYSKNQVEMILEDKLNQIIDKINEMKNE